MEFKRNNIEVPNYTCILKKLSKIVNAKLPKLIFLHEISGDGRTGARNENENDTLLFGMVSCL
jgi:hypothetical protein